MSRHTQLLPIRMVLDLYRIRPSRSSLEDEPLVRIQGVADLAADLGGKELPIWFDAEVQFFKDGSFEVLSLAPTYGRITEVNDNLFEIYRVTLRRALEHNAKRMVGVS